MAGSPNAMSGWIKVDMVIAWSVPGSIPGSSVDYYANDVKHTSSPVPVR